MRVLINGIPLLSRRSGVGNYVYFLSEALKRVASQHEWTFHYLTFHSSRVHTLPVSLFGEVRKKLRAVPGMYSAYRGVQEMLFYLSTVRKKIDIYHETNYAPFPYRGSTLVTVYDLSFFHYPETHPKERVKFYEKYFFPRLEKVSHFVAISKAVKTEMVKFLGLAPERITVTPLGLDCQYRPQAGDVVSRVTGSYGLITGEYVLTVGTLEPRKNLKRLLAAYSKVAPALRRQFPLVIVGGPGWLLEDCKPLLSKWGLDQNVNVLGYVPQENLSALYTGAALLAYPSIYEGFGLPPLEAMGCGCPVLTSNVSSLPEVVGNAAFTVNPLDVDEMASGLTRILEDSGLRHDLSAKGLDRSRLFSWDECARLTLEAYQRALSISSMDVSGLAPNGGTVVPGDLY